jgi:hypothetical protein
VTRVAKLLLDVPARHPALGFESIARALSNIITDTEPRFAVGIFGGWGSGKTTLMHAIDRHVTSDTVLSVWFSAWRYEREEHLLVPLLDAIREELLAWATTHGDDRHAQQTASVIGRVMRSIVAGLTVKVGLPGAVDMSFEANRALVESDRIRKDQLESVVPRSFYHASFRALDAAFRSFLGQDLGRRIVVFIDDLDRCLPENALQVLESMKLFFDVEGFVFVVGLDRNIVEYAIDAKYGWLARDARRSADLPPYITGADYVKKVFQLPYSLAPLSFTEVGDFLAATYSEAGLAAAQQRDLNRVVGPHLRYLVGFSAVNPRELKRYINLFILQTQIDDTLDPNVVLTLQTIEFRPDWRQVKEALIEFREEYLEFVRRAAGVGEAATPDLSLSAELGAIPDEFLDYVGETAPGHALLLEENLDRYLLSGEAVRSARDPGLLDALRVMGQVRQLLAGPDDQLSAAQILELVGGIEARIRPVSETSPVGRSALDALLGLRYRLSDASEMRMATVNAAPTIQDMATELSRRLRRLYRAGDLETTFTIGRSGDDLDAGLPTDYQAGGDRIVLLRGHPSGQVLLGDNPVGVGGQAAVYPIHEDPSYVVKLFFVRNEELARRLQAMVSIASAAEFEMKAGRPPILTWPSAIAHSVETEEVIGYAMRRLADESRPLETLFNARSRHASFPNLSWNFLVTVARNVAALVAQIHSRQLLVGDLSPRNLVVTTVGLLTLLDCDSMEFLDPDTGERFASTWATLNYAAPEIVSGGGVTRSAATDAFSLAVLVCQVLLVGDHPFMGIAPASGDAGTGGIDENIKMGASFLFDHVAMNLPRGTVDATVLPPEVLRLARLGFGLPETRPTAAEWRLALDDALGSIQTCATVPVHKYGAHLWECPWCRRVAGGDSDPFATTPARRRWRG